MRGRLVLVAAVAVAFGAASPSAPTPAAGNGRFPSSTNVMFRPEHDDDIYLAVTFGLMVSHDDGWHWEWMCEDSIGYGGGLALRDGGDEVLAGTVLDDLHRSTDGGQTFARITPAPQAACLEARADGDLFACGANWDPDYFTLGRSQDGAVWSKVQHDTCELGQWPALSEQFAVTGPVELDRGLMPATAAAAARAAASPTPGPVGRPTLLIVLVGGGLAWMGRRRRKCCN